MRPVILILGCVCAALLVACGGSKDASKPSASATAAATRAPETTATQVQPVPTATTAPTQAATAEPTTAPAGQPTLAPPTPPPGGGGGPPASSQATVVAQTLDFVNKSVTAKAGTVTLTLQNKDLLVAHNVMVNGFGTTPDCTGLCETSLTFTAGPGTYRFSCTIHTDMVGSLTLVP